MNNEIILKLTIDGQDASTVLKLTQKEYDKLYNQFKGFPGFPPDAITSMKALQEELLRTYQVTGETKEATADFIKYYGLSEVQIQQVINSLKDEQKVLSVTSAEYKTHSAAISNLTGAYNNIISKQNSFPDSSKKVTQGTSSMNMAIGQFGYALGDSSMFLLSFRSGVQSIANNIPMIIQYFQYASNEAKGLGQTIGQSLVQSLKGPGGLLLAVNAVMLVMQLLPAIFKDTTKEVKKQSDEIKKLKDEYSKLTTAQIKNYLFELDKQLSELDKKHQATVRTVVGSAGRSGAGRVQVIDKPVEGEERYGSEWETVQNINNRKKALQETQKDMGVLQELNNQVTEHQRQLEKLSKNPDAEFYWKKVVPNAKTFEEAQKAVRGWVKTSQDAANESKGKEKKEHAETYEEKVSKLIKYYEELSKYDKKYNDLYKAFLDDQLNYYMNTLVKQKGGLEKLSADQLEMLNNLKEKLTQSRFAPRPDFSNLNPIGLDANGMKGVPLTDKEEKEKKDALKKEKELLKLKSELLGETYDEEKQEVEDWYQYSMDKYQDDLLNHKTTTEEKELIEKLYHKKLADLEEKTLEKRLESYQKAIDGTNSLFSTIYDIASQSASGEIDEWKNKEEKKIEAEHKAALSHAKTEKQKERIDEQYQAKKDKLEQEANERAKEKLLVWFRLQQAASIAQATINTYEGADKALAQGGVLGPILAAVVIANGLANVAMIANQKMPGYEKGSMSVVGENGPEIIAPMETYAAGQAELIMRTVNAVQQGIQDISIMQSSSVDPAFASEIKQLNQNFKRYADSPIPIYNIYGNKFAKETTRRGLAGMKRDKLR